MTTHLHLHIVLKLRMIGGTPLLFLYTFMAWTGTLTESGTYAGSNLIKHSMPDPRQFYHNEGL